MHSSMAVKSFLPLLALDAVRTWYRDKSAADPGVFSRGLLVVLEGDYQCFGTFVLSHCQLSLQLLFPPSILSKKDAFRITCWSTRLCTYAAWGSVPAWYGPSLVMGTCSPLGGQGGGRGLVIQLPNPKAECHMAVNVPGQPLELGQFFVSDARVHNVHTRSYQRLGTEGADSVTNE